MRNKRNIRIRIKDIAKKLNYSTTTVSKALRNRTDVLSQTASHIQNAAEKMGYYPNIFAKSLATKRSNILGMIVPKITDIFFSNLVESMFNITFYTNYSIVLMISQENALREKNHLKTLLAMQAAGIIISISNETRDYRLLEKIRDRNIPIVFVNSIPEMEGIKTIPVTNYQTALTATQHAINLGYNNIAYTGFKSAFKVNQGKFRKFESHISNRKETCLILKLPDLIFTTLRTLTEHLHLQK
jgi:LacI family transcriptional regulator